MSRYLQIVIKNIFEFRITNSFFMQIERTKVLVERFQQLFLEHQVSIFVGTTIVNYERLFIVLRYRAKT